MSDWSIFEEPWWLEATAPGAWGEVLVRSGDETSARLPYVLKERLGLRLLTQPPLTPTLGPWMRPAEGGRPARLAAEKHAMTELIAGLPRFDVFQQSLSPRITNWLPFHWAGFRATVRYTYRLPDLSDLDRLWSGLESDHRREIRRAAQTLEVTASGELSSLLELVAQTFRRQRSRMPYGRELVERIDAACAQRNVSKTFVALDRRGIARAGLYLVWDRELAHALMTARHDEPESPGAMRLVQWEAIKFASGVTQGFDFDGSMLEPVERVLRGFGAEQVPYFRVTKVSRRLRAVWPVREFLSETGLRAGRSRRSRTAAG